MSDAEKAGWLYLLFGTIGEQQAFIVKQMIKNRLPESLFFHQAADIARIDACQR